MLAHLIVAGHNLYTIYVFRQLFMFLTNLCIFRVDADSIIKYKGQYEKTGDTTTRTNPANALRGRIYSRHYAHDRREQKHSDKAVD